MATSGTTYLSILNDLKKRNYKPIYYLMGEESFFIDSISDYIRDNVLESEEERDFNQIVVYGSDTTINEVIQRAKAYPMGAERQVIIIKEAQNLMKDTNSSISATDTLAEYLIKPMKTTILVFCHKNGTIDRRKKVVAEIEKVGVLFESKKIKEGSLPDFIEEFLSEYKLSINQKAESMIIESVGSDLCRMTIELNKLVIALPTGVREITPEFVEQHIGISKDFNIFEFKDALINKNIYKANQIASYYESNPKTYPIQLVTAAIFPYFANLMLAFYSSDKTERGIADQLGLKNTWSVKDYIIGMRNYTALQTMNIISLIRKYDAKSKGVDTTSNTGEGLLKELLFQILH